VIVSHHSFKTSLPVSRALVIAGATWLALIPPAAQTSELPNNNSGYSCQQVPVLDDGGQPIFGIEDMALDEHNDRLILSAYDRFAVMEAMEEGMHPPDGGLYALPLGQLVEASAQGPLRAAKFDLEGVVEQHLHPHGIGLFQDGDRNRLAVVSRLADLHDASVADLLLFDVNEASLTLVGKGEGSAYCRANDVALVDPDTALFTFDQSRCGAWGVWAERVFQPRASGLRVARFLDGAASSKTLIDDVAFANGVAIEEGGRQVLMTASRDRQLRVYETSSLLQGELAALQIVVFDGGPDNVSVAPGDERVTAVHPSPFDLFLHINGWGDLTQSRVVVTSRDGATRQIIDGAHGEMPGAATSALLINDMIVVSSAWDTGIGICKPVSSLTELRGADGH